METMGLTETAAPVFSNPMDPKLAKVRLPRTRQWETLPRLSMKKANELPRGEQGEIMIKGDNVMKVLLQSA